MIVYWLRRDFRLLDNLALTRAVEFAKNNSNQKLTCLYILDEGLLRENNWNIGSNRREYLSQLLVDISTKLPNFKIIIGKPVQVFESIAKNCSKQNLNLQVFANDDIEPFAIERDNNIDKILTKHNFKLSLHNDQLSVLRDIRAGSGNIYSVFTPYKNAILKKFLECEVVDKVDLSKIELFDSSKLYQGLELIEPENILNKIKAKNILQIKNTLGNTLGNTLTLDIDETLAEVLVLEKNSDIFGIQQWYKNEQEALEYFDYFNKNKIIDYKVKRDDLEIDTKISFEHHDNEFLSSGGTSKMSVALKWGLVSARTLKRRILQVHGLKPDDLIIKKEFETGIGCYISELAWREFYRYILLHFPMVMNTEFQPKFRGTINWINGDEGLVRFKAWIQGRTGYALVDAAMIQLARTGWMHNRSRMLVASILTKNLGVDWRWGQEYFRIALLDLDEASNNGGWQWGASVGADPKPIRIFNSYLQSDKYDTLGLYRKKWLPENYDYFAEPIIEHKLAREQAIIRYKSASGGVRDF